MSGQSESPPAAAAPTFAGYPDGCPLPGAEPAAGAAFRVVEHNPPTDADFLSLHDRGETPKTKQSKPALCRRRALSVYRDVADARHHLKKYAAALAGRGRVAAKVLTPDLGVVLLWPTPDMPTHAEWWCADGADRKTGFLVIE